MDFFLCVCAVVVQAGTGIAAGKIKGGDRESNDNIRAEASSTFFFSGEDDDDHD